jgi:ribonuclease P protein component
VKYAFGKSLRLLCSGEFKAVFDDAPYRASHQSFLILARPNTLDHPRLGLVVAKKHLRFAVSRNRIKRLTRELFRQQQDMDNAQFTAQLMQQLQRILKKSRKQANSVATSDSPASGQICEQAKTAGA